MPLRPEATLERFLHRGEGHLPGLVGFRVRAIEENRLAAELDVRTELLALANDWRHVLSDEPQHARPIVTLLLNGRVTITPASKGEWTLRGEGTLTGLFTREIFEGIVFSRIGAPARRPFECAHGPLERRRKATSLPSTSLREPRAASRGSGLGALNGLP